MQRGQLASLVWPKHLLLGLSREGERIATGVLERSGLILDWLPARFDVGG